MADDSNGSGPVTHRLVYDLVSEVKNQVTFGFSDVNRQLGSLGERVARIEGVNQGVEATRGSDYNSNYLRIVAVGVVFSFLFGIGNLAFILTQLK